MIKMLLIYCTTRITTIFIISLGNLKIYECQYDQDAIMQGQLTKVVSLLLLYTLHQLKPHHQDMLKID